MAGWATSTPVSPTGISKAAIAFQNVTFFLFHLGLGTCMQVHCGAASSKANVYKLSVLAISSFHFLPLKATLDKLPCVTRRVPQPGLLTVKLTTFRSHQECQGILICFRSFMSIKTKTIKHENGTETRWNNSKSNKRSQQHKSKASTTTAATTRWSPKQQWSLSCSSPLAPTTANNIWESIIGFDALFGFPYVCPTEGHSGGGVGSSSLGKHLLVHFSFSSLLVFLPYGWGFLLRIFVHGLCASDNFVLQASIFCKPAKTW